MRKRFLTAEGQARLDAAVAGARAAREQRLRGYREQALKLYPHVCARCGREFSRHNLHELTVHHRDHNHGHNPPDGSNWELLCLYCHDAEHQKHALEVRGEDGHCAAATPTATHNPFAALGSLLKK